jgi:hypothetical protein
MKSRVEAIAAGLKPRFDVQMLTARLKPCPCYRAHLKGARSARLKSYPDALCLGCEAIRDLSQRRDADPSTHHPHAEGSAWGPVRSG